MNTNKCLIFIFLTGALLLFPQESVYLKDPNEIIKKMDKIMYPNSKSELYLLSTRKGKKIEEDSMISYSKDINQKIIIRFTSPASEVGNDIILLEKNVWQIEKDSGRIIKVPSNLTFGDTDFSYGDVVRLNLSDNYIPEIISEDNVKWIINLTAKEKSAPYYRIEMEISKADFIPIKGTCFGKNDKVIKYMVYSDIKIFNGKRKPSKVTVTSPYLPDDVSFLETLSEELKEYSDRIFNKNNLEMRQEENQ